ncbi:MAG: molecular chaperone HtpG [Opitutales bacterium]|nr:molecular chaperone HtpG [Opitutales bacterium]
MEYKFKAEVKQVLDIVINSLYTDKEIFVRELISNASDASEKVRFAKLSSDQKIEDGELKIKLALDDKEKIFSIEDFGVGMTEDELVQNLGTIAHSGSKAFVEALKESNGNVSENLIGQFGVGFYSVFMVSDKVEVFTKSEGGKALKWSCAGDENFTIEECDKAERGTKIVAHLKPEYAEFASADRIREIVEKYSAYVEFPIFLGDEELKTRQAIWLKAKSDITAEQYEEFYKFQAHAFDKPLDWLHFKADAPVELNALIYIPSENPERLGFGKTECGVSLYCKKVLIDPSPKNLFPEWMRFAKGVIDSSDIPLNISRESMQDSGLIKKLGKVVLKKFIKHLAEMAKKDSEKYDKFFKKFGVFIKEGSAMDLENRTELEKLLRYESSLYPDGEKVSLDDYVSRMKESQKEIYYACGADRKTIESAPYLEAFTARGIEVLFFYDGIDPFVAGHIGTYKEKQFVSIDSGDIELPDAPKPDATDALADSDLTELKTWIKSTLGDEKVAEVLDSGRLVDSPVAALNADGITPQMRAMLRAMNPDAPMPAPAVKLEINPRSPVIKNLDTLKKSDESLAKLVLEQLYDNALLSAGLLENPRAMANRLNEILARVKS